MNRFLELENDVIKLVNLIRVPVETKEEIKETMMIIIVNSCIKYSNYPEFKKEVDQYYESTIK